MQAFLEPAAQNSTCKLTRIFIINEQNLYEPEVQSFSRQGGLALGHPIFTVTVSAGVSGQAQLHKVLIKLQEGVRAWDHAELNGFGVRGEGGLVWGSTGLV